jgi:hypothetical protein
MRFRDVVDELHDQDGLADAGAAEQADLAALRIRREQVDDLDARHENFSFRRLIRIGRRGLMDGAHAADGLDRTGFVDRLADDVHDAAERGFTDRNRDRRAGIGDFLAAGQAFRRVHRNAADGVLAEMLGDFENKAVALVRRLERVENFRQVIFELHVDDGADDLGNAALRAGGALLGRCCFRHDTCPLRLSGQSASAPEMISISSLVI